jgi:hypothetical protein
VARPSDPAHIQAAQREGLRYRLLGSGMLPERVEAAMAAWEAEAARRGVPEGRRYSDGGRGSG